MEDKKPFEKILFLNNLRINEDRQDISSPETS